MRNLRKAIALLIIPSHALFAQVSTGNASRPIFIFIHGRNQQFAVGAIRELAWRSAIDDGFRKLGLINPFEPSDFVFVDYGFAFEDPPFPSTFCKGRSWRALAGAGGGLGSYFNATRLAPISRMYEGVNARTQTAGWVLSAFPDVKDYFSRRSVRACEIDQIVRNTIQKAIDDQRPVILVAHSLGGFVAFSVLNEASSRRNWKDQIPSLITFGSQVPLRGMVSKMSRDDTIPSPPFPPIVRSWVNVQGAADPLAYSIRQNPTLKNSDSLWREYRIETNPDEPHEAIGYLKNGFFAALLWDAWCSAIVPQSEAPSSCNGRARYLEGIGNTPDKRGVPIDVSLRFEAMQWRQGFAEIPDKSYWSEVGIQFRSPYVPLPVAVTIESMSRTSPIVSFGWSFRGQFSALSFGAGKPWIDLELGRSFLHYRRGARGTPGSLRRFQMFDYGGTMNVPLPWLRTEDNVGSQFIIGMLYHRYLAGPLFLVRDRTTRSLDTGVQLNVSSLSRLIRKHF